ncbi:hypothetical protein SDC9_73784 [bioreactor metagenome]|uniref:Uncharacterized protein n=1 Tax=bioreactor metagenome TaxID=1076179 RepID=A0A644YME2_9ZZZZ
MGELVFRNMIQQNTELADFDQSEHKEMEALLAEVSVQDKISVAMMITGKLSGSDISTMVQLVRDGQLTSEEKQNAMELLEQRFTAEDLQKIKDLYEKYKDKISIVP